MGCVRPGTPGTWTGTGAQTAQGPGASCYSSMVFRFPQRAQIKAKGRFRSSKYRANETLGLAKHAEKLGPPGPRWAGLFCRIRREAAAVVGARPAWGWGTHAGRACAPSPLGAGSPGA